MRNLFLLLAPFCTLFLSGQTQAQWFYPNYPFGYYPASYYTSQTTYYRGTPSRGFYMSINRGYASPFYGPPLFYPSGPTLVPVYPAFVPVVPVIVRPAYYYPFAPAFYSANPFGTPFSFTTFNFGPGPFGW